MNLTNEVASFIINYVEESNNTALIVYNSKTEEAWLKLAPQLNAISQKEIVFRDWNRLFSNWTRNILTKHRLNKQLNPLEERYMKLRHNIKMSIQNVPNAAIPSTSAVNQTSENEEPNIVNENFIKYAEKVSELAKNWDFKSITAELKKFNDLVEEKNLSSLETYMCLTEMLTKLSTMLDST